MNRKDIIPALMYFGIVFGLIILAFLAGFRYGHGNFPIVQSNHLNNSSANTNGQHTSSEESGLGIYSFSGTITEISNDSFTVQSDLLKRNVTVTLSDETAILDVQSGEFIQLLSLTVGDLLSINSNDDASVAETVQASLVKRLLQ